MKMSAEDRIRFWAKVLFTDTCWLWGASKSKKGYGQFLLNGQCQRAHRVAYFDIVGPTTKVLDHKCRERACVRPSHLDPCTIAENTRRGESGRNMREKTHCRNGHAYEGENLQIRLTPEGLKERRCRQCRKVQWADRRRKNTVAV